MAKFVYLKDSGNEPILVNMDNVLMIKPIGNTPHSRIIFNGPDEDLIVCETFREIEELLS